MENNVRRIYSGAPWETEVGYCRAIARSGWACVSGTTAVDASGRVIAPGDPYAQTKACLSKIQAALEELGVPLANVVRTRMYVARIADWAEVGRAHREYFAAHPPATTLVEVGRLIDSGLLVEIEADAVSVAAAF